MLCKCSGNVLIGYLCFSDVFGCDLNAFDNNFCQKSLVVIDRWESAGQISVRTGLPYRA